VRVAGPDACDYLQRMVSNDVEALQVGDSCPALLLTAKARVIAPLIVLRLRARCEIELEEHTSALVFGGDGIATDFPGAHEVLDAKLQATLDRDQLEARRIEARVPRWGREIDDRVLPAEAGLEDTHVSFSKGCYPGQEPVARLHYRGKANRGLRVLELADVPPYDAELVHEGKVVGRVTSAARRPDGSVVALAYVRAEVPDDAALALA
jgi:folate-binding protein YgfZ